MTSRLQPAPARGPIFTSQSRLKNSLIALRRSKLKTFALVALFILGLFWVFSPSFSDGPDLAPSAPFGTPNVVIVTSMNPETVHFKNKVIQNREDYAKRHGYGVFITDSGDYDLHGSPSWWSKIPSVRHAMSVYPYSTYFFYLGPTAMIANMDISIDKHIMAPQRLKENTIVDVPVVPPDSVIKTFSHVPPEKVDFVISQDKDGLGRDSFIIRRGDWAKFFLDVWFDPLYRSYNFQKAEQHALEHIVQWHGTILAKLALVPQNILNSYIDLDAEKASENGVYKPGHFVVNFGTCYVSPRNCNQEMDKLLR